MKAMGIQSPMETRHQNLPITLILAMWNWAAAWTALLPSKTKVPLLSDLSNSPNIVSLTGSTDFSVQTQPASDSISVGGADLTFVVRCTPTDSGERTATVSLSSNDPDESPYTFAIACSGVTPEIDIQRPASTSIVNSGTDDIGNQTPGTVSLTYTVDNSGGTSQLTLSDITASNQVNVSNFNMSYFHTY